MKVRVELGSRGKLGRMLEGFGMGTFEMDGRFLVLVGRMLACMEVEAVVDFCFNTECCDLATCFPLESWF